MAGYRHTLYSCRIFAANRTIKPTAGWLNRGYFLMHFPPDWKIKLETNSSRLSQPVNTNAILDWPQQRLHFKPDIHQEFIEAAQLSESNIKIKVVSKQAFAIPFDHLLGWNRNSPLPLHSPAATTYRIKAQRST